MVVSLCCSIKINDICFTELFKGCWSMCKRLDPNGWSRSSKRTKFWLNSDFDLYLLSSFSRDFIALWFLEIFTELSRNLSGCCGCHSFIFSFWWNPNVCHLYISHMLSSLKHGRGIVAIQNSLMKAIKISILECKVLNQLLINLTHLLDLNTMNSSLDLAN